MTSIKPTGLIFLLFLLSCTSVRRPSAVEYGQYRISAELPRDSVLIRLTQVYRDSLGRSMNEVIGIAEQSLERQQPSGTLNDFVADAMLYMGQQRLDSRISVSVVNYGGLRLTQVPAGPITRSTVFELMPFDNQLLIQEVKGSVLQQFLDAVAQVGGWPLGGVTMKIRAEKAVEVRIAGAPIDPSKTYVLAVTDYVANVDPVGKVLRDIPAVNKNYLLRDAVTEYIRLEKAAGRNIRVSGEKRITHDR